MKKPDAQHLLPEDLQVKKSTLPGAGKGLFSRKFISKGMRITEYKGLITTFKQIQDNPVLNPYVYMVNRNHVIDAMHFPDSLGRYVNDAAGPVSLPGLKNNAEFRVVNKKVFLYAIADILPGSEIFVSYGQDYWDAIAFNQAVKKSYGSAGGKHSKK